MISLSRNLKTPSVRVKVEWILSKIVSEIELFPQFPSFLNNIDDKFPDYVIRCLKELLTNPAIYFIACEGPFFGVYFVLPAFLDPPYS